jgi:hypothetical protein
MIDNIMMNTSNKAIYICIQLELAPDTWLANVVSLVIRRTRFADGIALRSGIILDAHCARRHRSIEQAHYVNGRDEQAVPKAVVSPKDD